CGVARSSRWPRIEKLHLSLQPKCACCGDKMDPRAGMQVHHIFPFHYSIALGRPDLELDLRNLDHPLRERAWPASWACARVLVASSPVLG
ncbi:MAG: hypothetical protein JST54_34155, partial [Deltaproteobacteria bacterium]|nr:hypothetical protein [Deltaproteobacteria bacterium]